MKKTIVMSCHYSVTGKFLVMAGEKFQQQTVMLLDGGFTPTQFSVLLIQNKLFAI